MFPEDESTMTLPGTRAPVRSPSVTMESAVRSLTDPPGLNHSHLPQTSTRGGRPGSFSRTSGVRPIASSTDSVTVVPFSAHAWAAASRGAPMRHDHSRSRTSRMVGASPQTAQRGSRATAYSRKDISSAS